MPRILVLNPNTSTQMTELLLRTLGPLTPEGVTLVPATGRFGAAYISSRSAAAIAGHAALDAYAEHGQGCDAVYLACFGDPGLLALRELAPVPVIGMAAAACAEAAAQWGRFSIVTGGERWRPMLTEFVRMLGLGDHLASVETLQATGGEIAQAPTQSLAALAEACMRTVRRDGARAVILGGAGLAGLAERIQPLVEVPVICSTRSGFRAVLAALPGSTEACPESRRAPLSPVASIGLSSRLAALMSAPV
jgi:allantoin racemase